MPQLLSFHRYFWLATMWLFTPALALASIVPSPCDQDAACRRHLDQALQLERAQHYEAALREFRVANQLKSTPRLAVNIGRTLHKLGRFAEALKWYREAGRGASTDATLQQELRGFVADAKLATGSSLTGNIVIRPSFQVEPSIVHLTPVHNNICIGVAQSLLSSAAAQETQRAPLYKQPLLWVTLGVVLAASAVGVAAATWPRPWQPEASLASYPFFSATTGGAR